MTSFSGWMAGRKTYWVATTLFLVVLGLVFDGRMDPATAASLGLFGMAGFAVTFRAALAHHQAEVIQILQQIAAAGSAARSHNQQAELTDLVAAGQLGLHLATTVSKEITS